MHDGPGIRTTVFFQGCALRCPWCQNPEALSLAPAQAPEPTLSLAQIVEAASRDKAYYDATGGGVTLSGGEPLLQHPADLIPLLEALAERAIPVAVETSLHAPWAHVAAVAPLVELFLVDLKVVDEVLHKRLTGQSSRRIHQHIRRLVDLGAPIRFRMVMVPGFNDGEAAIRAAATFLRSHGHDSIELLKVHRMYEDKARRQGLHRDALAISDEEAVASVRRAQQIFADEGVRAACHELDPAKRRKAVFPARVHRIQDAIRGSAHSLCFEAARLKTAYYRREGFAKPAPVHRAERLAYVLENKAVVVYPDELLVGNFTSKRRGGQVWEEYSGVLLTSILHQIDRQTPVPFACSAKDKLDFYTRIAPFWWKHGLFAKVHASLEGVLPLLARASEMSTGFNNNMASIAHFIVNYERLLAKGTSGLLGEVRAQRVGKPRATQPFYDAVVIALKGLEAFAARYADELERLRDAEPDPVRRCELDEMATICRRVPRHPAETYHQALQSMLFLHVALCLESFENAVSPGRLDQILYPYYQRDKAAGLLDHERAKELLALFILKLDEAVLVNDGDTYFRIGRLFETMSTDQTVTAGGLGRDGRDATNELTYALLDICELQPYAANMTARVHPGSPPEYVERIAEVYLNGSPMPALYNDEIYVDTLRRHYGTPLEEARNYAIVGCVEPNASDDHFGNTDCANMNVALPFLQALRGQEDDLWNLGVPEQVEKLATKLVDHHLTGGGRVAALAAKAYQRARRRYLARRTPSPRPPASMDELLARYQVRLNHLARAVLADHQRIEAALARDFATPLASSLFAGCLASGKDVNEGGATLNSSGIQAVGITDVADSLHALDDVVFRHARFSLEEVLDALDHDFAGPARGRIRDALLALPKFGQDDSPEAVEWVNRTLEIYVDALKQVPGCPRGGIYTAGYYALNVNDVYGKKTPALPSGRRAGVPLANSVTPHHGMQAADLLSALNAVAGVDFARYAPNGTTVTFTIDAALFQGPEGVKNLSRVFRTFFTTGGMQLQPNVISRELLLDAYHHPERHPFLLVRVAGYCAYYNDLSDDLKKIILNRTCYG